MGGFASGLAAAGFGIAWAVDENAHACASFRHRLPQLMDRAYEDATARGHAPELDWHRPRTEVKHLFRWLKCFHRTAASHDNLNVVFRASFWPQSLPFAVNRSYRS